MEQQTSHRWTARALLLLIVLGLLGMHGLPDAMASPSQATAMPTHEAMSSPLAAPAAERVPARSAQHAVSPAHRSALRADVARSTAAGLATPTGCVMDHEDCVTVLRDSAPVTAAAPALMLVAAPGSTLASTCSGSAFGSRAPPDVSLIGLGISRT